MQLIIMVYKFLLYKRIYPDNKFGLNDSISLNKSELLST